MIILIGGSTHTGKTPLSQKCVNVIMLGFTFALI